MNYGLTTVGKEKLQNAADNTQPHSYAWFMIQDYNKPSEKLTNDLTLPAIFLRPEGRRTRSLKKPWAG